MAAQQAMCRRSFFIYVEGSTDKSVFQKIFDRATVYHVEGKSNVLKMLFNARERSESGNRICVIDADFSHLLDEDIKHEDLFVVSEGSSWDEVSCNDLESAMILTDALAALMMDYSGGGPMVNLSFLRNMLLDLGGFIGSYRVAFRLVGRESMGELRTGFIDNIISYVKYDRGDLVVKEEVFTENVRMAAGIGFDAVNEKALELRSEYGGSWRICRGHDLCYLISMYINGKFRANVSPAGVEDGLRRKFNQKMLIQTAFGCKMLDRVGHLCTRA
ncbi:MAG: DUF4435 domain-containing protein [Candidatus Sericytochromatia bacterium]|nr:DUF4435 domain-containing protein [Candidatus Sericytochromatia bacterium]